MKRKHKVFALIFTLIIIVLIAVFSKPVMQFLEIDQCFDLGGRYNYEKNVSEYELPD